jgi:hypothetical protein
LLSAFRDLKRESAPKQQSHQKKKGFSRKKEKERLKR